MAAASCMLVVMRDVPVSMMAPSAFIPGTTVLPTFTPSRDTIQYLHNKLALLRQISRHQDSGPGIKSLETHDRQLESI